MSIRVECSTPDLEHCYIEVSERWTRADIAALFVDKQAADLFRRKVTACHLECVNSAPITDSAGMYDETGALEPDLDVRLIHFVPAALIMAVDKIASLGKANARLSSGGTGRAEKMTPPMTTETETTQAA